MSSVRKVGWNPNVKWVWNIVVEGYKSQDFRFFHRSEKLVQQGANNHQSLIGLQFFIPRGFAHGLAVLSETAVFQYKCDEFYHPEADGGINIKDESLGIDWRIPMEKAILSDKDLKHACLKDAVLDFDINDNLYWLK